MAGTARGHLVAPGWLLIALLAHMPPVAMGQEVAAEADVAEALYPERPGGLSPKLQRVRTLIRANVLDLALELLEAEPIPSVATRQWLAWERQLWALYRSRRDWEALRRRVQAIPADFPAAFRQEAVLQSAQAQVRLGQGAGAREALRQLLVAPALTGVAQRRVRHLIVESYLADGRLQDAGLGMRRYQSDFRAQDAAWLVLSAQVHLQLGDAETAISLLVPVDTPRARLLLIYARLQNRSLQPQQAVARLEPLLQAEKAPAAGATAINQSQVLALMIYASLQIPDLGRAMTLLESLIGRDDAEPAALDKVLPHYTKQDLLQLYSRLATDAANAAGILTGEENRLFNHALQLAATDTATAKAIYGHLLQVLQEPVFRHQVCNFYISALMQQDTLAAIPELFGPDNPLGELVLSGNVGLELSNVALEQGRVSLAAMASQNLAEIPADMDDDQWRLHVARVSVLAGDYEHGAAILEQWLQSEAALPPEQIDRVLQPVFDLQTAGQHELALDLLLAVRGRTRSQQHLRELSFWLGESYQATGQYLHAAEHYLYSALLKDNGLDQWGEAARFHAAESLQSANLFADARTLLTGILARTSDENRKNQIKRKLQELTLLESSLSAAEP